MLHPFGEIAQFRDWATFLSRSRTGHPPCYPVREFADSWRIICEILNETCKYQNYYRGMLINLTTLFSPQKFLLNVEEVLNFACIFSILIVRVANSKFGRFHPLQRPDWLRVDLKRLDATIRVPWMCVLHVRNWRHLRFSHIFRDARDSSSVAPV